MCYNSYNFNRLDLSVTFWIFIYHTITKYCTCISTAGWGCISIILMMINLLRWSSTWKRPFPKLAPSNISSVSSWPWTGTWSLPIAWHFSIYIFWSTWPAWFWIHNLCSKLLHIIITLSLILIDLFLVKWTILTLFESPW